MDNEDYRRKMAGRHAALDAPCPPVNRKGSAARRNQTIVSRCVGQDPLARRAIINPSRIQPKGPKVPAAGVTPESRRQHP